jgi:hypothetical protein
MIEPAVVLVGETASVVVVLLAAMAGWQIKRMLPINIAQCAESRKRFVMLYRLSFSVYVDRSLTGARILKNIAILCQLLLQCLV